jgi:hypothetical protein
MGATVTQALGLGQYLFCIVIKIGHVFLSFFTPYYMQRPCQRPEMRKLGRFGHFFAKKRQFYNNTIGGCLIKKCLFFKNLRHFDSF